MRPCKLSRLLILLAMPALACTQLFEHNDPPDGDPPSATVGVWQRAVLAFTNTSYTGNPFELELDVSFTHSGSGTTIVMPGYYAGDDTWKVGFMPSEEGDWAYQTLSVDPDLNAIEDTVHAVSSSNKGLLKAAAADGRKWRFADGTYLAVPVALRMNFFSDEGTLAEFEAAADFVAANNMHMLDTRLQPESATMLAFDGDPADHRFNLEVWDRMEARMEALAERGLGAYIMAYTDDSGAPTWAAQSATEELFLRYMVARLAGYPVVLWDTGIDVSEYRTQADIDWFGTTVRALDPYDHPISSRAGGGSGDLLMAGRTYESRGDQLALIDDMIGYFEAGDVPVGMFDAWGENRPSHPEKDFRPEDVRRSMWKALVAGGLAVIYRGSDGFFHMDDIASDLESESWIGLVNPFVEAELGATFGSMVPAPSLVANGYALADPDRTNLLIFLMGANDKWDTGDGSDVTVKLSGISGEYVATWFDTRTGSESSAGTLAGGVDHVLTPPSTDDWVLLLTWQPAPPAANEYFVAISGSDTNTGAIDNPWRTIAHAFAQVSAGDIINVRAGTYNEVLDAGSKGGSGPGAYITLRAYQGEEVVIDATGLAAVCLDFRDSQYIQVEGIKLHYCDTVGAWLGPYITLRDVEVAHTSHPSRARGWGIMAGSFDRGARIPGIQILNVTAYDNYDGINIWYSQDIIVRDSEFFNNCDDGLDGLEGVDGALIERNAAYENGWAGVCDGGDGFKLGQYASGGAPGSESQNSTIRNNLAYNNRKGGFVLTGFNLDIYHNTSYYNRISLSGRDNVFRNNIVVSGSFLFNNHDTAQIHDPYSFVMDYNLLDVSTITFNPSPGASDVYYSTMAEMCAAEGLGCNSQDADPLFVDRDNGDFHLLDGSPAIDNGIDVSVSDDYDENARPAGGGYDIGAFEKQ